MLRHLHEPGRQGGSYLRELTDSYWYDRDKYGGERFVQFYFACQPALFEAECQDVSGISLDDLEMEFWEDVQRLVNVPIRR